MNGYLRNRSCPCLRCRARGLTWAVVLVTLGVLFLMEEFDIVSFDRSWPILLIAIGLCILAARTASVAGHIQPFVQVGVAPSQIPATPPPPAPNDQQVKL